VGQLDDKSLFYLRSRGLSEKDAEKMLVHAFASDLLEKVSLDGLKQELANSLNEKLRIVND
jgi:Fe-S cluster assembly protein SufD